VSAALDRIREQGNASRLTTLRVVVEANLPRGQNRPPRLEYQRLTSYRVDCHTPEAFQHARATVNKVMKSLDGISLPEPVAPVDLRAVPWQDLLAELDRRGIASVRFDDIPDAVIRREFGRRLRGTRPR
jgi:hypothetical protein